MTDPDDIRPALERDYAASQEGSPSCVNVITDPMEQMITRSNRASALIRILICIDLCLKND